MTNAEDKAKELYRESLEAVRVCLESLKFIRDNSPTNGIVRGRAEKTIIEVERILNL